MNHGPVWVWKQRSAVTRFLVAFYLRRTLRFTCGWLPPLLRGCKPQVEAAPLPTRRRPAAGNAKSG